MRKDPKEPNATQGNLQAVQVNPGANLDNPAPNQDNPDTIQPTGFDFTDVITNENIKAAVQQRAHEQPSTNTDHWEYGGEYELREFRGVMQLGSKKCKRITKPNPAKQQDFYHHSDIAADVWQGDELIVYSASIRGDLHYFGSQLRQDAYATGMDENKRWIIAAISDGVSSAYRAQLLADYISRQAVLTLGDRLSELKGGLEQLPWQQLSKELAQASFDFCARLLGSSMDKEDYNHQKLAAYFSTVMAATLELAVVQAHAVEGERQFACACVAGDGAAYVINEEKGLKLIKKGKQYKDMVDHSVASLPISTAEPQVFFGQLSYDDCLLLTTDGLSDKIGDGSVELGGFLCDYLPLCQDLNEFIQIVNVSMYQAGDDRTAVLIKEI